MENNIYLESDEQIDKWHWEFSLDRLTEQNLPLDTVVIECIPYSYHELYREILRRVSLNG